MKRIAVILLLAGLVSFWGCKQNGSLRAGFVVHTLQDERWKIERDAFTAKFTALGGEVFFEDANLDDRNQYHLVKKLIEEKGIDVLVIVPVNSKTAASIARLCHENGVKVISYDIIIENCDLELFASFDNYKIGEQMAQYAISHKPRGNYVLLWGDSNMKIAHWIKDGQMNVLDPLIKSQQINLVYQSYVENWSPDNSAFLMKRIIDFSNEPIDAIIASADGIAQGVVDAYVENRISEVPLLTGQDASSGAIINIKDKLQAMTIRKPFKQLAEKTAECAWLLARNKPVVTDKSISNGYKDIPAILLATEVVDATNINQ